MKIVIYAGMGKTGSTTIQRAFAALRQNIYTYAPAPPGIANFHNRLFLLCFSAADNVKDAFPNSGDDYAQTLRHRKELRRRLDEAIAANTRPVFLFTSELLAGAWEGALRRFAAYCESRFDEIEVYAYVRPPVSYMQSMLPQMLRSAPDFRHIPFPPLPRYRRGLGALDDCFGRERVRLSLYDRDRLRGGDVALDFAARIGAPLREHQVIHANESMPLNAIALLYAFRAWLPQRRPAPWQTERRRAFFRALGGVGGDAKLRFAPELVMPILERERADIEWMENRLGEKLADPPAPAAGQIASTEELLELAVAQVDAVETLALARAPAGSSPRQRLLYALCALYDRRESAAGAATASAP